VEYPHRRYIVFLLTKKMTGFEIRADCLSKGLTPPNDESLAEISAELGPLPSFWRMRVQKTNIPFRRWLRDKGVLPLWVRDASTEIAFKFLARAAVRKDFEAVILVHGSVEQAHRELLVKYPEALVPPATALKRYYQFFWDVGSMSPEGIFEHIEASQEKEDYLPALRGDLVRAYGKLGLQQQITYERLLQETVEAGFAMAQRIRREADSLGGQTAAGLSTAVALGIKAGQELQDLHLGDSGDSSLRQDAADFVFRRIPNVRGIPSIDDVDGNVIDADYAEAGADNVHRLPVRRD
jgi:hypothetical protein